MTQPNITDPAIGALEADVAHAETMVADGRAAKADAIWVAAWLRRDPPIVTETI